MDENQHSDMETLGDRMKAYEREFESHLSRDKPFIIRLDGHTFSTFTSPFEKPWDFRIADAMAKTTMDLMEYFHCTCAYTQSDEITLVFPAIPAEAVEQSLIFSGRVGKITTLAAGYCSARFCLHISQQASRPTDKPEVANRMHGFKAHFDARVFHLPNDAECLNNLVWRCRDVQRNSKNNFGRKFFSAKQLHSLNTDQVLHKCITEKNADWNQEPAWFRYGTTFKKSLVNKRGVDNNGNPVEFTRSVILSAAFPFNYSEQNQELITNKYLPANYPVPFVEWS